MKKITAFAWRSGLIEFTSPSTPTVPEGALAIATGPERKLIAAIEVLGRQGMGKSEGTFLVPGVPEAELMKTDPVEALIDFRKRVKGHLSRK